MPQQAHFERYVLPLVPVLAVLAGSVRLAVPFALVALALPLAWSVSDARELTRTDTRLRADAWVAANVPRGDRIAADPSTLPLARPTRVVRLELPGPGRPSDPERDLARLRREGVKWVIVSGAVTDRVLAARDRYPREARVLRAARSRPEARLRRLPGASPGWQARGFGSTGSDRYRCRDEPRAPHRPRHRRRRLPLGRRPARARDHRQPRARADLRQLALRLGLADRDRPHGARDRLLGGRDRRRPAAEPVPPHLACSPSAPCSSRSSR